MFGTEEMIELKRDKEERWIIQKNISSATLMKGFVEGIAEQGNVINPTFLRDRLSIRSLYTGRSDEGSDSTMGVRLSQACFYMFGYKQEKKFIPTPTTQILLKDSKMISKMVLVNLFAMQYPNPYSNTSDKFKIRMGMLLIKLLLDRRLGCKLFIDEAVWFLPFLRSLDEAIYEELVYSILSYRKLSYWSKEELFHQVENYDDVFSNVVHELNYYFFRFFESFGVLTIKPDSMHNEGRLFKFKHGNENTYRTDAYKPHASISGFIQLNENILEAAERLNESFDAYEEPLTQGTKLTRIDWIRDLYEFELLKYIECVKESEDPYKEVINMVQSMIYESKFGSLDGKTFENSLKPLFELFRENQVVEIISGPNDTDLLCVMREEVVGNYKIIVDAKKTKNRVQSINPSRITKHINKNNAEYCIIVSPRFSKGAKTTDIKDCKIVTLEAETLGTYCLKESLNSNDGCVDYTILNRIISDNLGTDITYRLQRIIQDKYSIG